LRYVRAVLPDPYRRCPSRLLALLWVFGLGPFALLPACARRPASSPPAPAGSSAAAATAVLVPDFSPHLPVPSPWAEDPLWQQAFRGDPIDLGRLAQREGAAGLLEAAQAGGRLGLTALSALPLADDGELALGWLCDVAARLRPDLTRPLLQAIRGILAAPDRQTEQLDRAARERCGPALDALASRAEPAEARDLAASALAVLNDERHDHE
jgi:hypothetical protein